MTTTTLFGLALAPLYAAIAQVESDRGATSDNVYQVRRIYLDDLGRINGCHYPDSVMTDKDACEKLMFDYWHYYGYHYHMTTRKPVTYEVLARMHNGGPDGWKKASTVAYWAKVKKVMEELK